MTAGLMIDDGWTFNGLGNTIFLADPAGGRFVGGALVVSGGTASIEDVAIDGAALSPGCPEDEPLAAIAFVRAGGTVERVTVDRVHRGTDSRCGIGIVAADIQPTPLTIADSTIRDVGDAGVDALAGSEVMLINDRIASQQAVVGVRARSGARVTVGPKTMVTAQWFAVVASGSGTTVLLDQSTIGGAMTALELTDGAEAEVTGTSIMHATFGATVNGGSTLAIHGESRLVDLDGGVMAEGPGGRVDIDDAVFDSIYTIGVMAGDVPIVDVENTDFTAVGAGEWDRAIMISLAAGGNAVITGNTFTDTSVAISVFGTGGTASISGNRIARGRYGGMYLEGEVRASIEDNVIDDLTTLNVNDRAIKVTGAASAEINRNHIIQVTGPARCAVEVETTGTLRSVGNDYPDNRTMPATCGASAP
jgi:hypothetical protein